MSELTNFDAVDQAGLVASGKVSARELIDAAIAQAEAVNGDINAIIHPRFERARDEDVAAPHRIFKNISWHIVLQTCVTDHTRTAKQFARGLVDCH